MNTHVNSLDEKQKSAATSQQDESKAKPSPSDAVNQKSSAPTKLQSSLQEKIDATSEIDAEKVAVLKAAIANGEFKINAKVIAEKLLRDEEQ